MTTTISYPAGPEPISIELRAEYFPEEGHEYSDEYYLNVAEGAAEVPGDTDSDIQLDLDHVPACRDGIDNDFTGVMDAEAPGCIDYDASTSHEVGTPGWVYEPDDDVELLQALSRKGLFGGDEITYISSASGNREYGVGASNNFSAAFTIALGQIDYYLKHRLESDQAGEIFAVTFTCGDTRDTRTDTTGTTEIVLDDPSVDGWHSPLINGVDASFFSKGLACVPWATHITKINGDPPGDGDDDVVFAVPDTSGSATLVSIFEPEMAATAEAEKTNPAFGRQAEGDVRIQDVRTSNPREALRALDPRRKQ